MRQPDAFPPDPRRLTSTPDRTPPAVDLTVSVRSFYFNSIDLSQINNNDVAKLTDWFNSNKLTVNLDKTRCMYYRTNAHDDSEQPVIRANGVELEFVK